VASRNNEYRNGESFQSGIGAKHPSISTGPVAVTMPAGVDEGTE